MCYYRAPKAKERHRIIKLTLQWFIRFSKFPKFTRLNETPMSMSGHQFLGILVFINNDNSCLLSNSYFTFIHGKGVRQDDKDKNVLFRIVCNWMWDPVFHFQTSVSHVLWWWAIKSDSCDNKVSLWRFCNIRLRNTGKIPMIKRKKKLMCICPLIIF